MNTKTNSTAAVVLSVVSTVATAATTYCAIKDTMKAHDILVVAKKKKVSKKDTIKKVLPIYIPTMCACAVSMLSGIGSTILSKKAEMSLVATAAVASRCYGKYKTQVKKIFGKEGHLNVLKNIGKEESDYVDDMVDDSRKLYWEEHIGFFKADPEKLAYAFADMNQRLYSQDWNNTKNYVILYNLIQDADAEIMKKDIDNNLLSWGWSLEQLGDMYDNYPWIHMIFSKGITKKGKEYTIISFEEEMILDPGNHGEAFILASEEEKLQGEKETFVKSVTMEESNE